MTTEELERIRLNMILIAGISSLIASAITIYLNYKKRRSI